MKRVHASLYPLRRIKCCHKDSQIIEAAIPGQGIKMTLIAIEFLIVRILFGIFKKLN